jgi:hypothetical protein
MAYSEELAERVRETLAGTSGLVEKKMFGGVGYMVHGNMACGVLGDDLIVRVGPENYQESLADPNTRVFDTTGRVMKGWVMVSPGGHTAAESLKHWVDLGVSFALTLPAK